MAKDNNCPCGKNKQFMQCCGRFLVGNHIAKTPEQLMRSRYCAYALGGYGEYLFNTWHPSMVSGVSAEELSVKHYHWDNLDVLSKTQKGNQATVEFKAYYQDDKQKSCVLHENSFFQRISGSWLYVGAVKEEN